VQVTAGDREYVYSLTLPQLWDNEWVPPAGTPTAIPRFAPALDRSSDLWPLLALLGAAGLLVEWLLYGRGRRPRVRRLLTFLKIRERGRAIPVEVRR
jgi:hypothetical protein